jgi:hypothetical protein
MKKCHFFGRYWKRIDEIVELCNWNQVNIFALEIILLWNFKRFFQSLGEFVKSQTWWKSNLLLGNTIPTNSDVKISFQSLDLTYKPKEYQWNHDFQHQNNQIKKIQRWNSIEKEKIFQFPSCHWYYNISN